MRLRVDGDGFVALVAPDAYRGFVHEDWALDDLLNRFVEQANEGALFIAYPGPDSADGVLKVQTKPPRGGTVREASGLVHVGAGGLWLTDYTQLTMAAQFADESAISGSSQRLPVGPGRHRVTLNETAGRKPTFILTVLSADPGEVLERSFVPWFP